MKQPTDCENMFEIREAIDSLDEEIIHLLGQRYQYVKAAAKFKTSQTDVKAPERFRQMLLQRRAWAVDEGLNPDVIEKLYADLVNYFIAEELEQWQRE